MYCFLLLKSFTFRHSFQIVTNSALFIINPAHFRIKEITQAIHKIVFVKCKQMLGDDFFKFCLIKYCVIPLKRRNGHNVFLPGRVFPQRPSSSCPKSYGKMTRFFLNIFYSVSFIFYFTHFSFFLYFFTFSANEMSPCVFLQGPIWADIWRLKKAYWTRNSPKVIIKYINI